MRDASSAGSPPSSTLRRRLTIWLSIASMGSLLLFALVTALVISFDERGEVDDPFEAVRQALMAMALAAPVGLVVSTACAFLLTRRALVPVEELIRAAGGMSGADLSRRLPLREGSGEELWPLIDAFNELLERIEEASAATSRFAAEASHELRTPLAVIASRIEVESRHPRTSEEWERTALLVLDEVRRLSSLVDALLKLARAEASSGFSPVDVRRVLEMAIAGSNPIASSRRVTIDFVAGESDLEFSVAADPDTLASAFTNLLSNAIQHSPERGIVRVTLEGTDGRVAVHVDDSGPGLTDGEIEQIFEPFERGTNRSAAFHEGVGLGLSIARRIVEKYGGSITARRSDLGGARFTIELGIVD